MSAIASQATIRIAYDGEALDSGAMDVRDLAPALLALSDLFDESNKVLNGPDRAVQLRVQHDIKHGSFDVTIQVVQTWASKILSLFSGDSPSGAANLIEILGFSVTSASAVGLGLFKLIKWLRGRQVKRIEYSDDGVRLIVEGDQIIISRPLASLLNDIGVRRALAAVLAPLRRDGIESLQVKTPEGTIVESVSKMELPSFEPPVPSAEAERPLTKNEFEQVYTIVSLTFKEGNKWRVHDGQNTISATIEDAAFLARVSKHEVSFVKDDMIRCAVRQEQSMTADGLKTETVITRVIDHTHTYRQGILPLPAENPPRTSDSKGSSGTPNARPTSAQSKKTGQKKRKR
jgi:hypothetical protein